MYIPKLFENKDLEAVREFIDKNGFAIIVNQVDGRLWGTHVPLFLDEDEQGHAVLHGHVAKANPQWRYFREDEEMLAIFNGPHAYISSSWYDHENVPTWNYIAVHAYGVARIYNEEELMRHLTKLVDKYEKQSEHPVSVGGMSHQLLADHLGGLIGFEIRITDIQPAYKLSQNRHGKNHDNIVHELRATGDPHASEVAESMELNRKKNEHKKS